MNIPCVFEQIENGRTRCKVHNQCLLYKFGSLLIYCDGEDELIAKHGLSAYLEYMNLR